MSTRERQKGSEQRREREGRREGGRIGACDEVRGGKKAGENNLV